MVIDQTLAQVALLLSMAVLIGFISIRLKQPLLLAFIAVGMLVGPSVLDWVSPASEIDLFARMGIILLLFIVGLKLDVNLIRSMGKVSLATGLGQVFFTALVGYFIAISLDFEHLPAIYIAVALTFSSTIVIVKLLSDKDEIDSLYGRISVGFLIVQDMVVVVALIALSSIGIGTESNQSFWQTSMVIFAYGIGLLVVVGLLSRYVFLPLTNSIAQSRELLVLFAVSWAVVLSVACEYIGLSKEVGGFIAGVSLASLPYRDAIASRLDSLRNFLLLFFFITLGASIDLHIMGSHVGAAILFSLFVLIGNPLIVMIIMGYLGYRKRTGFLAGLTVAQISEFSLIFAALGMKLGHIDSATMGLITLVGLVTIGVSTYMIIYNHELYEHLSKYLGIFERKRINQEKNPSRHLLKNTDILVFGLGRYGGHLLKNLSVNGHGVAGIDFDPERIERYQQSKHKVWYGDAEDIEFVKSLPLSQLKCIISTIPNIDVNKVLLEALSEANFKGQKVIVNHLLEEPDYQKEGADLILPRHADAALLGSKKILELLSS